MTRAKALELLVLTLLAAGAAALLPLTHGQFAWSWDALNHHIYLGLTAEQPRWHLDVIPASYQSYQYPYLYWPVYRMSLWQTSGTVIGVTWAAFQATMLLWPMWWISERLLPASGRALEDALYRATACVMGFMSLVVLSGLETTANDLLAAVPLLWGIAVGLQTPPTHRQAFIAAALWGVSAAFKLSNGLFVFWLLLWWWVPQRPHWPLLRGLALATGAVVGFGLTYAPWGLQLWRVTGNPFYPYFGSIFAWGT